jgi:hypothetical protein
MTFEVHVASASGTSGTGSEAQSEAQKMAFAAGRPLTFGRGAPELAVDLLLSDPGVSRLAGELAAAGDYWLLSNFSRSSTYVIDNLEGAGEYIRVPPRRVGAPVPFEISRLTIPTENGGRALTVFAPEHVYIDPGSRLSGEPTAAAFSLDETARYFQVLVALCEPRLREPTNVAVPTTAEVVARLGAGGDGSGPALSDAAVTYHIDYLARHKFRLRARSEGEPGGRLESKREMLVAIALRFGLVHEDHLRLLPPRPVRRRALAPG